MNIDAAQRELAQRLERRGFAVDRTVERPESAMERSITSLLRGERALLRRWPARRPWDHLSAAASPEYEDERIDDQRFARTGLAGEDV